MSDSWIVIVECKVLKQLICKRCTEEQAAHDPWEYAVDEMELGQSVDWTVLDVKANE